MRGRRLRHPGRGRSEYADPHRDGRDHVPLFIASVLALLPATWEFNRTFSCKSSGQSSDNDTTEMGSVREEEELKATNMADR